MRAFFVGSCRDFHSKVVSFAFGGRGCRVGGFVGAWAGAFFFNGWAGVCSVWGCYVSLGSVCC